MIKSAIFDVDGTLLDSMQMWINFGHDYLRRRNIDPPEDIDEIIQYFSLRETAEYFSQHFDLGSADLIEEDVKRVTQEFYFEKVQPKDGTADLLKMLSESGVRMYVATATYRSLIEPALERVGLMKYLEGIVTCPEVGTGKDKPDVFLTALRAIDGDIESAWVFEDAMHAVKTAKAAGFHVCAIYDLTEESNRQEMESLCDIYTESFGSLCMSDFNR